MAKYISIRSCHARRKQKQLYFTAIDLFSEVRSGTCHFHNKYKCSKQEIKPERSGVGGLQRPKCFDFSQQYRSEARHLALIYPMELMQSSNVY